MAQLEIIIMYRLNLDRNERRLIGLALSGRLTSPADKKAARELNEKMLSQEVKQVEQHQQLTSGALNIATSQEENPA